MACEQSINDGYQHMNKEWACHEIVGLFLRAYYLSAFLKCVFEVRF